MWPCTQARDEHRAASETKIKHHMRDVVNAVRLMERVNFALHAPNSAAVTQCVLESPIAQHTNEEALVAQSSLQVRLAKIRTHE